jgi:hypothetical protein
MSKKLIVLPSRLGVRHRSMTNRSEKTALPAPMMLIFTLTDNSPEGKERIEFWSKQVSNTDSKTSDSFQNMR